MKKKKITQVFERAVFFKNITFKYFNFPYIIYQKYFNYLQIFLIRL
jgi:hypothetical protein